MHHRILYVSRAAPDLDLAGLHAIIRAAHARNQAAGISGALILVDGYFAQILEGPEPALGVLFARIAADPRHGALDLRLRARALAPLFPHAPMALRTRACLDEALLAAFDYRPGFPAAALPADALIELMARACRRAAARPLLAASSASALDKTGWGF